MSQQTKARVVSAFRAMKDLGISEVKVKPVLKSLLKLYDKNWALIEEDNYRALAAAIFDREKRARSLSRPVHLKEPKVEPEIPSSSEKKNPSHALLVPNDEPITDDAPCLEVPDAIIHSVPVFNYIPTPSERMTSFEHPRDRLSITATARRVAIGAKQRATRAHKLAATVSEVKSPPSAQEALPSVSPLAVSSQGGEGSRGKRRASPLQVEHIADLPSTDDASPRKKNKKSHRHSVPAVTLVTIPAGGSRASADSWGMPLFGLDYELVQKHHDLDPTLPAQFIRYLSSKEPPSSDNLPKPVKKAAETMHCAWTVGMEEVSKSRRQTNLMLSMLTQRVAALQQTALDHEHEDAEKALADRRRFEARVADMEHEMMELKREKKEIEQERRESLRTISELNEKVEITEARCRRLSAEVAGLKIDKAMAEESAAEQEEILKKTQAELSALQQEKTDRESNPFQNIDHVAVYCYYTSFFDAVGLLLKNRASASADLLLNFLREKCQKMPLHEALPMDILDLERDYKIDLSWWPDPDQLMFPVEEATAVPPETADKG